MIAVLHQLVHTAVGLFLGLSLPYVDANQIVLKAKVLPDIRYMYALRTQMRSTNFFL